MALGVSFDDMLRHPGREASGGSIGSVVDDDLGDHQLADLNDEHHDHDEHRQCQHKRQALHSASFAPMQMGESPEIQSAAADADDDDQRQQCHAQCEQCRSTVVEDHSKGHATIRKR